MLLIGSRALKLRNQSLLSREPVDFDFISTNDECDNWIYKNKHKLNIIEAYLENSKRIFKCKDDILEFEIIELNSSSELLHQLVEEDDETISTPFGLVPSLDLLFTIKSSHKYKKFHLDSRIFWKTAQDYHRMKSAGAKIRPEYELFHKMREKESYKFKTPSLNRSKEDFFAGDGVAYTYDHDALHKVVALQDKPAYTYFGTDGQEVLSDKDKFFASSEEIRINAVIEESCVLALERARIPTPDMMNDRQAYAFALAKVSSSITGGWFRKYSHDHIFKALQKYPPDYYQKFLKAQKENKIEKSNPSINIAG